MFIHSLFENKVKFRKDAIALEMDNKVLSYNELNKLSNQMAQSLIESGVKPGEVVGVCLERSFEMIAGLIAVMKAGAAYLPLDTEYPRERLRYMIDHSRVSKVLCHRKFSSLLMGVNKETEVTPLIFEEMSLEKYNGTNPIVDYKNIGLIYVIYTSGSTGHPKGIAMGSKALCNLIDWQNNQGHLGENSITLQFTPISFDVHFQEIFSTLTSGGKLILLSDQQRLDTLGLLKIIDEKKVNKLFLPYVALNHLCDMGTQYAHFPQSLKEVTTAGEQLKITRSMRLFFEHLDDAILYNHYGPSETHVVTSFALSGNPHAWPNIPSIGSPIQNTELLVLDENLNALAAGNEGEIYIRGVCLADGYLHSEKLTNERFIQHEKWGRIYRTGDLGYANGDKNYIFMGRRDSQVKMRGYRIELGEIELAVERSPYGGPCVVNVIDDGEENYLCAYVTGTATYNNTRLRESLRAELPEYMVPSYFIKINQIPLTPSGKVDYKNLPSVNNARPELSNDFEAASTPSQLMIESCWKKHLKVSPLGIDDSFFDLGGNSLMAIRILAEINQQVRKKISIVNFFQYSTIRSLGKFIDERNDLVTQTIEPRKKAEGNQDIAIIAMNGKFPGAENVDEYWEMLLKQNNPLEEFPLEAVNSQVRKECAADNHYVRMQGLYPGQQYFDYNFFGITPREAELMDPQQRKFLELCHHALELAGYRPESFKGSIGVYAGMGNSKYNRLVELFPEKALQLGDFNVMLGLEKDYIATRAAFKLNLKGPALSIHTGCSTSLVAIIEAVKSLRLYQCDMALAGGISISGSPNSGHLYQSGGIFSEDGLCRPFDDKASGTLFTEGGGVVVLKRLSDAQKDGDHIIGVVKGVGLNNDGGDKMSFTAPSVRGQSEAILQAHQDANVKASTIGYIEAHGTATPIGDPIEVQALTNAFEITSDDKQYCYLGSVKSNIGHTTAAAGVASFIKSALAVQKGIIPGTAHFEIPNQNLELEKTPFLVTSVAHPFPGVHTQRRAGVSSVGVGGTNAHVLLEEYLDEKEEESMHLDRLSSPALFKLSAKTPEQVEKLKIDLINQLKQTSCESWKKIAYTLDVGRKIFKSKSYVLASSTKDLEKSLNSSPKRVLQKEARGLVCIFPGQGSQYVEMGKDLYEHNELFRVLFDRCNSLISPHLGYDLKNFIHQSLPGDSLNHTFYSQPSLFVIEYCLAKFLIDLGYPVRALLGHSVGEYVAATIAGVFSLEDGLKIIAQRAKIMRDLPGGMMISVSLEREEINKYTEGLDVDLAAINGKRSIVLAGSVEAVEQLKMRLISGSVAFVELKTSHGFHSRMMKPAVSLFKEFISGLKLNKPTLPLYSSVTGKREESLFTTPEYWAEQIEKTVAFYPAADKCMSDLPMHVFVEVGPKNVLSLLLKKEFKENIEKGECKVVSLFSASKEKEAHSFFHALAELWMEGLNSSQADHLYGDQDKKRRPAPLYPFAETPCWLGPFNDHQPRKFYTEVTTMTDDRLNSLKEKLSDLFEKTSGISVGDYDHDTSFMEMGMDSLFLTQISIQIKKELKVPVTFRQLVEELTTINALASYLSGKVASPKSPVREPDQDPDLPEQAPDEFPSTVPEPGPTPLPSKPIPGPTSPGELPGRVFNPMGHEVQDIINRQLDLMKEQMRLLSGVPSAINVESIPKNVVASSQRGADIKLAKDSFGAQAKITIEKTTKLDKDQSEKIQNFIKDYISRTQSSKKFTQENRRNHADPRAVTGFKPEWKEICYPIVVQKSLMQKLWDLDGNDYVDMTCGFGSNFFGNQNPVIKKHVLEQMDRGIELGPQHPLVSEVSRMINEMTGNERTAFCNTGSEAVLGAMRLARTVTGREKIIVFSGAYHGINDEVILRANKRGDVNPAAPGINNEAVSNMIVLDYGTAESLEKIRELAGEVAAVLVEPVQSRRCNFHPADFLKEVRKITEQSQTCLIFDEIITGFRIHPAGAQGHFGIRADLCTYGKIVGGGMPIGVISGKAEYMDALDGGFWQYGDDSTPTVGVTYFAGTFVRHPLALAAAKGALTLLKDGGQEQFNQLNTRARNFVDELNRFLTLQNTPIEMNHFGGLLKPKWNNEVNGGELLFALLRFNGVHVYDGFPWFINLAHTDDELQFVLEAFKKSVRQMQALGLFPQGIQEEPMPKKAKVKIFDPMKAPMIGAKIGRDDQGNPAWFMENPNKSGEFYLLEG